MLKKLNWRATLFVASLAIACGAFLAPASATTCYGTLYEYFESSAMTQQVGAKVVCPGFPDQVDADANGNHIETPWYTTTTVVCPCPSGGGGGGGGGEDTEESSP
jgi:hypothetical protein